MEKRFSQIVQLIQDARNRAIKAVNVELINLYWNVGAYIRQKLKSAEWGDKTVDELAVFIQKNNPELKGFNRAGLYRMIQFYDTYSALEIVAPARRQFQSIDNQETNLFSLAGIEFELHDIRHTPLVKLSWTHHRTIFSRCKTSEEKVFYMQMTIKENYSVRELERQISSSFFERVRLGESAMPSGKQTTNTDSLQTLKDNYVFEFLNLPKLHKERDLKKAVMKEMKNFILELGKDFLFMGQEYKIEVGNSDFYIDLLFYHRELHCLVAFELKTGKFKPEYLGKLNFYLEALDQDVKKENENPSIGILLCTDKENKVVEYSMNRSLSPALVAAYSTQLPDKRLWQQKLNEICEDNNMQL